MKTKYKILLGIISLALLASLYIAQSYALWTFTAPQTTTNSVSSGCFDIEYSETASSTLNLTQSYPIDDAQALSKETPYTFTIKNNCSISTEYTVTLNTLTSNTLDDAKIKYAIVSGSSTTTTGKKLSEATANADTTNFNLGSTLKKSYKLATGVLTQSGSVTFKLYLWIDASAGNEVMSQKFNAAVYVNNVPTNKSAASPTISSPSVDEGPSFEDEVPTDENAIE